MMSRVSVLFVATVGVFHFSCASDKAALTAGPTGSVTGPAEALFAKYVDLSASFDPKVVDLYTDDAVIHSSRITADGTVKKLELQGSQLKQVAVQLAALAKQQGDVSEYSDVRYRPLEGGFEVRTHRRSVLRCYVDDQHRMVLKPDAQGALKIVEEHIQTQSLSNCPDQDPTPLMQQQVDSLESRLPLQVDEDTRLDSLRIEGKALVYTYTLVNVAAGELDSAKMEELLRGMVLAQSCLGPNLRPLLDNGAQVSFAYRTKGGEPLVQLSIDERDCP